VRRGRAELRVGLGGLALVVAACVAGPWLLPPAPPADPAHAALLPPGTVALVLELSDGRTVVAAGAHRTATGWLVPRATRAETIPAVDVVAVRRHRFWLGADTLGRDVLHRLLAGGRVSLAVAASSLVVALALGLGVGLAAASGPRWLDAAAMRVVDAWMAFPALFLLILLAAVFRPGTGALVAILGATSWMGLARLVRGQALSVRERPFVLASRAEGSPWWLRWALHLVPNVAGPASQEAALRLGDLVIAEATLSFLGLGVQPPTPSWGAMVAEGRGVLLEGWWLAALPGLAIACTVVLLAVAGDGLQRALAAAE